jgi:hypothetical protein
VFSSPWSLEFVLAVIIGAMLVPGCRPAEDGPMGGPRQQRSSRLGMPVHLSNHEPAMIREIPWPIPVVNGPRSSIYIIT